MKALVIGAAGFVGGYLVEHLKKDWKWEVFATKLEQETVQMEKVVCLDLDILDRKAVEHVLFEIEPDYIFHLAAQSSVARSWKNPDLTLDVNIKGCVHILEAVRKMQKKVRILLVGSSEEYGQIKGEAVTEESFVYPKNLYAVTKVCQNMLGKVYADAYQMEIVMVRAFNHIGPKQSSAFVISDFCRQVAEIEAEKKEAVIKVGNLSAKRDFTDVRDIVRAYALLIQRGKAGETYNVGSGEACSIAEILEKILRLSKKTIQIEIDPAKLRPADVSVIKADIRKLKEATGWERKIPLEVTLEEVLNSWREQEWY